MIWAISYGLYIEMRNSDFSNFSHSTVFIVFAIDKSVLFFMLIIICIAYGLYVQVMTIRHKRNSKSERQKSNSNRSSLETEISSPKTITDFASIPATVYFIKTWSLRFEDFSMVLEKKSWWNPQFSSVLGVFADIYSLDVKVPDFTSWKVQTKNLELFALAIFRFVLQI